MTNSDGDKSDVQRERKLSFHENILNTNKIIRYSAYTIVIIIVTTLIVLHINNFISIAFLEFHKFTDNIVYCFYTFCRYGCMGFILAVSLYAVYHLTGQNISFLNKKENNLTKIEKITDQISAAQDYGDSDLKNHNSWEKTIKDCWCSLDFASLRLKNCKETITIKAEKSKAQLREINENMTRLEAKLSEERIKTADASSNTDLLFDLINDNVPSDSSLSEELTNKGSGESIRSKYNILQKVLEMGNTIDLNTNDKMKDRKKRVNVPPIQQWSMPKEIFSFGSKSSLASSRFS